MATTVAAALVDLAAVLRVELEDKQMIDNFGFVGLIPNQQIGASLIESRDSDGCGVAWVKLLNAYPATDVGKPAEGSQAGCSMLGFDVEMGITRCYAEADEQGNVPSPAELEAAVVQQSNDLQLLRRVVICSELDDDDYQLAQWQPIGPTGGLLGGSWLIRAVLL